MSQLQHLQNPLRWPIAPWEWVAIRQILPWACPQAHARLQIHRPCPCRSFPHATWRVMMSAFSFSDCPTDAPNRRNGRRYTIPHPQHNEIFRPGASMAMPPFDSHTPTSKSSSRFPRASSPILALPWLLPQQGCSASLVSSAQSPLPWLRNQLVGAGLPWPRPGPLARDPGVSSWKRVFTRPDGVSRALSGPWVVAALLAVPSEMRAPRSRRQGGRRVQNNRILQ